MKKITVMQKPEEPEEPISSRAVMDMVNALLIEEDELAQQKEELEYQWRQ